MSLAMMFLYNVLFTLGFMAAAPFYLVRHLRRGNYRKGFGQRFGFYPSDVRNNYYQRGCIWFRAVSVGEVHEALTIIWRLHHQHPEIPVALSVTTTTGYQVARRRVPKGVAVTYYPVDFSWCVRRALDCFEPKLIVLVESDIWPNLARLAALRKIPVALINARMSNRSLRGYRWGKAWFRPAFEKILVATAPDETAAKRLAEAGVSPPRIHRVGSLKYEVATLAERVPEVEPAALLQAAGAKPGAQVLVAGSTHRGEEEIFLDLFLRLRKEFPELFLVLAPRHAERGKEVAKLAQRKGVFCMRRTELVHAGKIVPLSQRVDCLLLDTTGELRGFYRVATVIFVGKSLVGRGGQNILEAAVSGNPLVFGPHMENFEAIARELVGAGAAVQVRDSAELEVELKQLLSNAAIRRELDERARKVIEQNLGAAQRTVDLLMALMGYGS